MKRTVNLRDMSAANNGQNSLGSQEAQNRKILSDLQKEKARLRMHQLGSGAFASLSSGQRPGMSVPFPPTNTEGGQSGISQRMALQAANSSSFGYFIPQDSKFGNLILPVIPRIGTNQGNA